MAWCDYDPGLYDAIGGIAGVLAVNYCTPGSSASSQEPNYQRRRQRDWSLHFLPPVANPIP